jgi:hypothetical protein
MDNIVNFPDQPVVPFPTPEVIRVKMNWYMVIVPKINEATRKENLYPVCFFARSRSEAVCKHRKWREKKIAALHAIKQYTQVSSISVSV